MISVDKMFKRIEAQGPSWYGVPGADWVQPQIVEMREVQNQHHFGKSLGI